MEEFARGACIGELEPLNPTGFDKLHAALELGPTMKDCSDSNLMRIVASDCGGVSSVDPSDGCTPLHWAVRYDFTANFVRQLLQKGANADGLSKDQLKRKAEDEKQQQKKAKAATVSAETATKGQKTLVGEEAERGIEKEKGISSSPSSTSLQHQQKHQQEQRSYYNEGVPTPLHECARYDHHRLAEILMREGGADPNVPDRDGLRPLHVCALWNNVKTARVLLGMTAAATADENGGDEEGRRSNGVINKDSDNDAQTATNGKEKTAPLKVADPFLANNDGQTPLEWGGKDYPAMKALLEKAMADTNTSAARKAVVKES